MNLPHNSICHVSELDISYPLGNSRVWNGLRHEFIYYSRQHLIFTGYESLEFLSPRPVALAPATTASSRDLVTLQGHNPPSLCILLSFFSGALWICYFMMRYCINISSCHCNHTHSTIAYIFFCLTHTCVAGIQSTKILSLSLKRTTSSNFPFREKSLPFPDLCPSH